jgi:hypothetical protein
VSNTSSALNIFIVFKPAKDTFVYMSHFLVRFHLNLFIIPVFEKRLKGGSPLRSPFQNAQHHHNHEIKAVVSHAQPSILHYKMAAAHGHYHPQSVLAPPLLPHGLDTQHSHQ